MTGEEDFKSIFDVERFFDLSEVSFRDLFYGIEHVWEALSRRDVYIQDRLRPNSQKIEARGFYTEGDVYVGEGTVIEPGAYIKGPTIIGNNCQIRNGAYIRGNVIVGDHCVIGHTTEVIRSIILNRVRADHFAYIGDSILGNNCLLGLASSLPMSRYGRIPLLRKSGSMAASMIRG